MSPARKHCYYERDHVCPTCGVVVNHDEYACDQCQQYVDPDREHGEATVRSADWLVNRPWRVGSGSPAEGRVGNHGEQVSGCGPQSVQSLQDRGPSAGQSLGNGGESGGDQ